jgi:hypothetical protein
VDAFNAKGEDCIYYTFCFIRSEFNIYILASLGEARVIVAGGQGACHRRWWVRRESWKGCSRSFTVTLRTSPVLALASIILFLVPAWQEDDTRSRVTLSPFEMTVWEVVVVVIVAVVVVDVFVPV